MALLVPVLILAILVLGWITWLAFGPRSSVALPSYLFQTADRKSTDHDVVADTQSAAPLRPAVDESEHVRARLHALNSSAASLTGNALHLELRPALHIYCTVNGRDTDLSEA